MMKGVKMKTNSTYLSKTNRDRAVVFGSLLAAVLLTAAVMGGANLLSNSHYQQAKLAASLVASNTPTKPFTETITVTATRLVPKMMNASAAAIATRPSRNATPS
jgi:predicted tellurium resistance membrane protein TerC